MKNDNQYCGYGHKLTPSWGGTLTCVPCYIEQVQDEEAVRFAEYTLAKGLCYMCGKGEAVEPSIGTSLILQGQGYCYDCLSTCLIVDVREGAVREAFEAIRKREEAEALRKKEEAHFHMLEDLESICNNRDYRRRW